MKAETGDADGCKSREREGRGRGQPLDIATCLKDNFDPLAILKALNSRSPGVSCQLRQRGAVVCPMLRAWQSSNI
jgi:hypothetical protein